MHSAGTSETPVLSRATNDAVATRRLQPQQLEAMRIHQGFAWVGLLVSGYVGIAGAAPAKASASFNALATMFPGELESVLGSAHALLAAGDHVTACGVFQRARTMDPCNVRGMDDYAASLLERGCQGELRQLARDMAEMDLALPEVWAVMASFWRSRGNWEKAIEYIDRCVHGDSLTCAWLEFLVFEFFCGCCHGELRQLVRGMADMDLALLEVWAVMASFWGSRRNWEKNWQKAIEDVDRCVYAAGLTYMHDLLLNMMPNFCVQPCGCWVNKSRVLCMCGSFQIRSAPSVSAPFLSRSA
jgi:hypothetical protein